MYKIEGLDVVTEKYDNKFKVSILDIKNIKTLFEYEFIVYSNFDEEGLIEDAIFMYKHQ